MTPAGETVDKSAVTRIKAEAAARFNRWGGKRQACAPDVARREFGIGSKHDP
jgi:hypothetical protein